jgi:hypothetical protein
VTPEIHFVQVCHGPVFIGAGTGSLDCPCGHRLIAGYDPAHFLGIAIQCGACAEVTTTPGLPDGSKPPLAVVVAEPVAERRTDTNTLPQETYVVGRAELDRIVDLYAPHNPADNVYLVSPRLLDDVAAAYQRALGRPLPDVISTQDDPFAGMLDHALAWAVAHLRRRLQADAWACRESAATSAAATNVAGLLHFVRTWSHHPLFAAMAATAEERGCSLHGLAPFAAAHCLSMQGNRIGFPTPGWVPTRIGHFLLASGPTDMVAAHTEAFDRFEYPYGRTWEPPSLKAAVAQVVAAAKGRINPRNPGVLLLSPGVALSGFDEALIEAVKAAVQTTGRKNRGLMAVAPIVLRMQDMPDPHAVRFGYGLFPIVNKHYRGEILLGAAG